MKFKSKKQFFKLALKNAKNIKDGDIIDTMQYRAEHFPKPLFTADYLEVLESTMGCKYPFAYILVEKETNWKEIYCQNQSEMYRNIHPKRE